MIANRRGALVCAVAVSVAAIVVCATAAQAQEKGNTWHRLRETYKQGETLKYDVRANVTGMMTMSGGGAQQTMPINVQLKTGSKMEVLEVDSAGTATVKQTMDEMNMDMQMMGQSMEMRLGAGGMKMYSGGQLMYDSSQAGSDELSAGAMPGFPGMPSDTDFSQIFVKGVTMTITRDGEVSVPEMAGQLGGAGFAGPNALTEIFLPRKLVRPGDRWGLDLSALGVGMPAELPPGIMLETTFEGIELFSGKQCAKIVTVLDVDVSQLPLEGLGGPQVDASKSGLDGRATAYFDIERGHFVRQEGDISIAFAGSGLPMPMGPPMGAGGASSNASMDMSMKIHFEVELKE